MMAPLGPDVRVPEDLLEVRTMLLTRAEKWKQGWLEEGRQEGREEGLQEGVQKGEATLLRRQLERRFGPLPDWAADRLRAAEMGLLEEWGLQLLEAGSLEDVFSARPA
jgi:predicted transposase YdaD